jgi:hypothetical protein
MQLKKMAAERSIGGSRGGMMMKIHVIWDEKRRARKIRITAGDINDFDGARAMLIVDSYLQQKQSLLTVTTMLSE